MVLKRGKITESSLRADGDFMVHRPVLDSDSYYRSRHRAFLRLGSLLDKHSTGSHFPIHRPRIAATVCRRRRWGFRLCSKHLSVRLWFLLVGFRIYKLNPQMLDLRPRGCNTLFWEPLIPALHNTYSERKRRKKKKGKRSSFFFQHQTDLKPGEISDFPGK